MEKRKLIILGSVIVIGLLLIGGVTVFEGSNISGPEMVNNKAGSNKNDLEKKIENFKKDNFQPELYSTLLMEINSSKDQGLIESSSAIYLTEELNNVYKNHVFNKADYFLNQGNGDKNTVLTYLSSLEKAIGKDARIDFYKTQIPKYDYYANSFPGKVTSFTNGNLASFSTGKYTSLKNEAENMPGLDNQYKSKGKFTSIKSNAVSKLNSYKSRFEEYDRERKLNSVEVEFE
ncbi:hypothetical protein [Empedobacter sp.]|uniref:hypothetical protein n=1 Tax=Empedobacter sp. TaxID=1927715 RepID=UPI0028AAF413|nr:hypothetical protein [Empedobacter sp.]